MARYDHPDEDSLSKGVEQLRRFERFYERHLRKLERMRASEDFTVADVRVLYELGFERVGGSGSWLCGRVQLDAGYVCRILKKLEAYGLVVARPARSDGRMRDWNLTSAGREFAESIESAHRERAKFALSLLLPEDRRRLVAATTVIEQILRKTTVPW